MSVNHHSVGLPTGFVADEIDVAPAAWVAFTEGPAATAEGPVYFSDIVNNRILRYDPDAGIFDVYREPSGRANGLVLDREGKLLACEGNEFCRDDDGNRRMTRTDLATGHVEVLTDSFEGKRYNAPNDVVALSNGLIYFTDPAYGCRQYMELDHDSVYRINLDGSVDCVITQPEIERPNGIAINPRETILYLVDSCPTVGGNRKIWAFDVDAKGELSNQRGVYDFAPGRGGDGMALDVEGNLYIAAGIGRPRGPHETSDVPPGIYVVTPAGELKGRIPVPEDVITNVTFGGDDKRTLYIAAGKTLYHVRVEIPGFLVHRM